MEGQILWNPGVVSPTQDGKSSQCQHYRNHIYTYIYIYRRTYNKTLIYIDICLCGCCIARNIQIDKCAARCYEAPISALTTSWSNQQIAEHCQRPLSTLLRRSRAISDHFHFGSIIYGASRNKSITFSIGVPWSYKYISGLTQCAQIFPWLYTPVSNST